MANIMSPEMGWQCVDLTGCFLHQQKIGALVIDETLDFVKGGAR